MSAIALSWVASITVGNQTAKQLLQFYACHNFGKPGFQFKNETLAKQLEITERSVRRAHKLLIDKNLIIKEIRYAEDGQQLTNSFYLNIPDSFVDNFMGEEDIKSPLYKNNSNINNKINNSELVPSFVDKSLWEKFKDHRRKIKKPMTDHAINLMLKRLKTFHQKGLKVNELLEESIISGWSTVYEPKKTQGYQAPEPTRPSLPDWTAERMAKEEREERERNSQGVSSNEGNENRTGNNLGCGNMLKDKAVTVSEPAVATGLPSNRSGFNEVKKASAFLLPIRRHGKSVNEN